MGEITDLIFTVLGKFGRVLNIRGQRICFIVWSVCLSYWTFRNYELGLKVQTIGCLVSLTMHAYGFYNWGKKGIGESK